jgi:hypothetical protein
MLDISPPTCPNYPAFIYISESSVPPPRHRFIPVRRENAINERFDPLNWILGVEYNMESHIILSGQNQAKLAG